jgi:hypothetical protein
MGRNPFPKSPPKYIRAQLYEYHFTDMPARRATGQWWRREYKGNYLPPIGLPENGHGIEPGLKYSSILPQTPLLSTSLKSEN